MPTGIVRASWTPAWEPASAPAASTATTPLPPSPSRSGPPHTRRESSGIASSATAGRWTFSSLDSLAAGLATKYERGLPGPLRPEGPVVDFHVRQFGVYAQDWWTPTARVTVTMGVRLDVPFLPDGTLTNTALKDSLGIDTGRLPSGNVLWSPRFSASYDLTGDGLTLLRGGVGLFSGHPPYRWLGNGYRDTGGQEALLTCTGAAVPPFDPLNQPTTCGSGAKAV